MRSRTLAIVSAPNSERARPMKLFAETRADFSAEWIRGAALDERCAPGFDCFGRERGKLEAVHSCAPRASLLVGDVVNVGSDLPQRGSVTLDRLGDQRVFCSWIGDHQITRSVRAGGLPVCTLISSTRRGSRSAARDCRRSRSRALTGGLAGCT